MVQFDYRFVGDMSCLYLHIPFCRFKCSYCSFNSQAGLESLHPRYRQALIAEIVSGRDNLEPLETLFLGGGTPTVLGVEDLSAILDTCADKYGLTEGAEISIEANPESVDYHILSVLREAGFNRLSIGIQSLNNDELKKLGRVHDGAVATMAVKDARRAGFDNLSLDLMYGLPGQTTHSWRETLQGALELGPRHCSAYQLTVEVGTPFHQMAVQGALSIPAEEAVLEMDEITRDLCREAGLHQYEIANFAQPGYECRHNLNYWHNGDYLGCGAGAVSYVGGVRERRVAAPLSYCEAGDHGGERLVEREALSSVESFKETVVLGLRLLAGVTGRQLQERYGLDLSEVYGSTLENLIDRGLIIYDGTRLALTGTGRRFANQVMAELV